MSFPLTHEDLLNAYALELANEVYRLAKEPLTSYYDFHIFVEENSEYITQVETQQGTRLIEKAWKIYQYHGL